MLCVDAAYPREGTVTSSGKSGRSPVAGYSLAPRGDGYPPLERQIHVVYRCSLAPRGDGYLLGVDSVVPAVMMQLSPARGRLRAVVVHQRQLNADAAYPREGTVTSSVQQFYCP